MQVLQRCKERMQVLAEEVIKATGSNLAGKNICLPRFHGFRLTAEIRDGANKAISLVRDHEPEGAIERIEETLRHLQCQQVVFLRNHALPALYNSAKERLIGVVPREDVDAVYKALNEFSTYAEGHVDLTVAGNNFARCFELIEHMLAKKHQREEAERKARLRQEAEAKLRESQRLTRTFTQVADEMEQLFAAA